MPFSPSLQLPGCSGVPQAPALVWPPREGATPHTDAPRAHAVFRCSCEQQTCCSSLFSFSHVIHEALLPLQSPWPGVRALCLLTPHRWTSWGQSPLTPLTNLYKIKLTARTGIYATTGMELAWRNKLTKWFKVQTNALEKRQQKKFHQN